MFTLCIIPVKLFALTFPTERVSGFSKWTRSLTVSEVKLHLRSFRDILADCSVDKMLFL